METTSQIYTLTPLRPNGKLPMLKGFTLPENLETYHEIALKSNGNYGVMMGEPSNVIVLDVDLKKVTDPDTLKLWELDSVKEQFGDTYIVRTPSGGLHVYLMWDERMKDWTTKLELNNEFKTDKENGYIDLKVSGMCVGEGSTTEKGTYTCINGKPDVLTSIGDKWFDVFDSIQSGTKNENVDTDFYELLPDLERLGFSGINQVSDYSFDCDQRGRGSKCPLCNGEHRSNHYQIVNDGFKVSVRNFSNKCNMVKVRSDPAFIGDLTPPEPTNEKNGDYSEATKFMVYMKNKGYHYVRCEGDHYAYNPNDGIWELFDKFDVRRQLAECDAIDRDYSGSVRKQDSLMTAMMALIDKDELFMIDAFKTTYGKLPFKNGVWDFHRQQLLSFSHEYRFFYKININYEEQIDEELANEIREKVIYGTFGQDRGDYYMKMLGRGVSGEVYDKLFAVIVGLGNSGKGVNAELLEKAFGKFVGSFNAGNLCKKINVVDEAKARAWMIPLSTKRLAICSEAPVGTPLDPSAIQNFCSGGDTMVGRLNYQNDREFKLQSTPLMFCNDMPEMKGGAGDPIKNRMRYLETQYSYLPKEQIEPEMVNVRVADESIKSVFVNRPDVIKTFAMMVCRSYTRKCPVPPECVIQESKEWNDNDNIDGKIKGLYETDKNSYIVCSQLHMAAKRSGLEISLRKLGMIMKSFGYQSTSERLDGKVVKAYKGIRLVIEQADY